MTTVLNGNRVRVVIEGEAWDASKRGFMLGHGDGNYIVHDSAHVKSVEVLPKPLAVGDTVKDDDYASLPVGAHVKDHKDVRVKVADKLWHILGHNGPIAEHFLGDPREIVYLP